MTARDDLKAFVWRGAHILDPQGLEERISATVAEESRSRLLGVQTRDGRIYHPDDVTFMVFVAPPGATGWPTAAGAMPRR